jgi:hypothetical protein
MSSVTFAMTAFAPVVLGFFGLGTGYLIYGPQELFGFPRRDPAVDRATGVWGIWMPGFCQFVTGVYLFVALTWFESLKDPALYTAALAFSAYGIHWFALGWNKAQGNDARPNGFMSIPFIVISVLGLTVFFTVGAWPVGVLFTGLALVYVAEFFASFQIGGRPGVPAAGDTPAVRGFNPGERALGAMHILVGLWLMYLTFATTLDISLHYTLPGG